MSRFLSSREVYDRYGIPWKRGVLFIGPPGNGKTHTVKALISVSKTPCIYVKTFTGCWGTDQDRIREVFEKARKITPSIVVLEDIDSLINNANRAFFLNELDGFASNTGVVVLATTNHPDRLDPAILDRPSRFDRKYYFNNPAPAERYAYVSSWSSSVDTDLRISGATISKVVEATEGFSFAYLKELMLSSMMVWISEGSRTRMDSIIVNRAQILTREMKSAPTKQKKNKEKKKAKKASA